MNNRKYITSTGVLLNGLKEDQSSLFQGVPPQLQSQPQLPPSYNTSSHLNIGFNQQQAKNFAYNQQNNFNMSQSFPMPPNPQLISQIPPNTNPMDYFQMKMQNSSNPMPPLPIPSKNLVLAVLNRSSASQIIP